MPAPAWRSARPAIRIPKRERRPAPPIPFSRLPSWAPIYRASSCTTNWSRSARASGGRRAPGRFRGPGAGPAVEVEVWDVPGPMVGALLATVAPPLGLGTVVLEDGGSVAGFLCEAHAVEG